MVPTSRPGLEATPPKDGDPIINIQCSMLNDEAGERRCPASSGSQDTPAGGEVKRERTLERPRRRNRQASHLSPRGSGRRGARPRGVTVNDKRAICRDLAASVPLAEESLHGDAGCHRRSRPPACPPRAAAGSGKSTRGFHDRLRWADAAPAEAAVYQAETAR